MRLRFFAFPLVFVPCLAWLGCEWAADRTPEVRPSTFGAEVIVSVLGKGSVVSTEPGIRCPGTCYARIVSNVAAEAAPRSITLRVTPDPGYRFARWEVDGSRVAGPGLGPEECSPVRRPAETPALGSATEVALGFGDVDGYPPPGMSEKCLSYSRVPVAYNLTAVFETVEGGASNDVWANVPTTNLRMREMMITSEQVLVRAVEPSGRWSVVTVDRDTPTTVTTQPLQTDADVYDMTYHVVWQEALFPRIGVLHRTTGLVTTWTTSPTSLCRALTSTAQHVYCRTADQQLIRWTIDGNNQTTIAIGLPNGDAMTTHGQSLFLTDDGVTTGASMIRRLTPPASPDAGTPALEIVATGLTSPRDLRASALFVYAFVGGGGGDVVRTSLTGGGQPVTYFVGDFGLLYATAPAAGDPRIWVANSSRDSAFTYEISSRTTSNQTTPFRKGLPRVFGLALDEANVYWTLDDAKIYRGRR